MQLKTYYSDSVDEALARATGELGPDAMLVYARDAAAGSRHLGRSEVVFAASGRPPAGRQSPERPARTERLGAVRAEIADLARLMSGPGTVPREPGPAERARMIRAVKTGAALRNGLDRPSVAFFIGPPGSGKTISVVKLAARQITQGQPAPLLVSFDNRVGGGEPLRSYAAALECGYEHAALPGDAAAAIRGAASDDLVLVDTPGLSGADAPLAAALEELTVANRKAEIHLTLSAGMKEADLSAAVERFRRFRPTKLLFTRLDETGTYGPLWSEAVRWNIPVSFLAFGQQIPEDIEPATAVRLADLALRPGTGWLRARRRKAAGASA